MPDKYSGKRVRCPGCDAPQRVPGGEAAAAPPPQASASLVASSDLLQLESSSIGEVRRLRELLIGCGACGKTIRLSEARLGKSAPCPKCGAVLKVDAFDLGKTRGDVVDLSHLELEQADPLLNPGASRSGSTLGGSGIVLDDSALGSSGGMSGSFGGASAAANAQEQMRELRDLNELKHSGAISNDEYKRRKSEIYSGRSLVVQATSRAADGGTTRQKAALGRYEGGTLPGPVKALIGVAVVGLIGFVIWSTVLKDTINDLTGSSGSTASSQADPGKPASKPAEPTTAAGTDEASADTDLVVADARPAEPEATPGEDVEPGTDETPAEDALPDELMASAVPQPSPVVAGIKGQGDDRPRSIFEMPEPGEPEQPSEPTPPRVPAAAEQVSPEPAAGEAQPTDVEPEPEPTAKPVKMKVLRWAPRWPDTSAPSNSAIGKACSIVKQIEMKEEKALIGMAVGPPAEGLRDPVYIQFADEMQQVLTQTAHDEGVLGDLTISPSRSASRVGVLEANRVHARHNRDASVQATIVSGVQDGYCVSYWFAGSRRIYPEFAELVGTAMLVPEDGF